MKLTDVIPNLVVADIDRSATFYHDVLGFATVATVPDQAPYVFVWLKRGDVSVFLNTQAAAAHDLPSLAGRPIGGTAMLYVMVEAETPDAGVDAIFRDLDGRAPLLMPLKDQFYGMREFTVSDPDGYTITFAQQLK